MRKAGLEDQFRHWRGLKWAALHTDAQGRRYQAGVFWAGEACVIGFRRDAGLITNLSEFMPHLPGPQI